MLTDGVKRASESIGPESKEFAIHVNGQELPFHDPRFQPGMATTYATEPTPGRHCPVNGFCLLELIFQMISISIPHTEKVSGKKNDMPDADGKRFGLCQFAYYSYPYEVWPSF